MVKKIIRIFLMVLLVCVVFGCKKKYLLSEGCVLSVAAENEWEYRQKLYYEISCNGKQMVSRTFLGFVDDDATLNVYRSECGVVAFTQKGNPNNVVILFDVNNNESWPSSADDGQSQEGQGTRMLEKFKMSSGKKDLILNDR